MGRSECMYMYEREREREKSSFLSSPFEKEKKKKERKKEERRKKEEEEGKKKRRKYPIVCACPSLIDFFFVAVDGGEILLGIELLENVVFGVGALDDAALGQEVGFLLH